MKRVSDSAQTTIQDVAYGLSISTATELDYALLDGQYGIGAAACPGNDTGCNFGSFDLLFRVLREVNYLPHVMDLNQIFAINFTGDPSQVQEYPDFINSDLTGGYPLKPVGSMWPEKRINSLSTQEPFIPFCLLGNKWSDPPKWGSKKIFSVQGMDQFCTLFRPSLTDQGVCYTYNGVKSQDLLQPSGFMDAFNRIYGLPDKAYPKEYFKANGIGIHNGLRLILDAHTLTGQYKYKPNKDNTFRLTFNHPTSFPLPIIEGIEITGGYHTRYQSSQFSHTL